MAGYFFLIDQNLFEGELRPALAESWQQRSFAPCRALCEARLPQAREFAERYYLGEQPLLIEQVTQGLAFEREFWRALVSELLFVTAADVPEVQSSLETLCLLTEPPLNPRHIPPREQYHPLHQIHFGSRDLTFGAAVYRPDRAGLNPAEEVRSLAAYLESIDPVTWNPERLSHLTDPEDRLDEIEFTRQTFEMLREMYQAAAQRGQVIVCEQVEV